MKKSKLEKGERMKQLTARVPHEVHRALKIRSAEEGRSCAVIVEEALRNYLVKGGRE